MIPERISRYRILDTIGSGGMGVVYRAWDERLEREVAVKVLASSSVDDAARRRFRREANALSRLSHPAINVVYDFDSHDGIDFLVLELVEGRRLDELLRDGPLPEDRVLALGAEIAAALAAAHERGIVHRDLKPGNVMVTARGGVKLLDFGLALLRSSGAVSTDTQSLGDTGLVVGTLAYIAPEQLLGRPVDERTDLYSMGVLLYETATGRRPFTASPATALINEILHRPAPSPAVAGARLSARLESLILALLDKDPGRRPRSAAEVESSLRAMAGRGSLAVAPGLPRGREAGAAAPEPGRVRSLAVLPLENLSRDPDQEFFADGMTEALITDLAQIGDLRVVSRTSAMQYKGVRRPLPEIARALQVDAVVEGSVARFGDRVRITAQLIEAATDRHLWARSYERDLRDVLALQAEVARAIAEEIRVQVGPGVRARLDEPRRVDPRAYDAYLRGRHHWNRRTEEGIRKGIGYFLEVIQLDPTYAQAQAALARAYDTLGTYAFLSPHEAFARARAWALRAVESDETLPEAHTALGGVLMSHDWDWPGAEREFRRAIELDANDPSAYHWYSDFLSAMGRHEEAEASIRRALELDPLGLTLHMTFGATLFYARKFDEAIAQQLRTMELDPTFAPAYRSLGGAYEQRGRYDEAIAAFQKAAELTRDLSGSALLAHALAISGREDEARRLLAELLEAGKERYLSQHSLAAVYAGLGEPDAAFEALERAFVTRDRGMIWLKVSPRFDHLRADPRFSDLLRRMKFPHGESGTDGVA